MTFCESDQDQVREEVCVFPASFAQHRLWFIEQMLPGTSLYTIPLVFQLSGSLHRSSLVQSIQAIVDRHEILRTTFDLVDGQLTQVIGFEAATPLQTIDLQAFSRDSREASGLSVFNLWVKPLESKASICGGKLPIHRLLRLIALKVPSSGLSF
jgi:Condensation domain